MNPVEDFADKWADPKCQRLNLEQNFLDWLEQAQSDFRAIWSARDVDLIAERIVQLGGIAEGTVRVAAGRSRLEEYPLVIADGRAHVEAVSKALSTFGREARATINQANELDDADTADIFTEISRGIDKWLWFVEAHTQAAH